MKIFKIIMVILLFVFTSFVQAQNFKKYWTKIDSTYNLISSNNKLKLSISLLDDTTAETREYQISVYNSNGDIIQKFSNVNYAAEMEGDFDLVDINFDNYDDLMVLINDDPITKCYEFWRFDTSLQKFVYDSLYYDLVSCNASFNEDSKTIETGWHDGILWDYSNKIYSYANGKLILIEVETQEHYKLIDSVHHEFNYRRIKKVLKGEELVIVKDVIGTLDEIDEKWLK